MCCKGESKNKHLPISESDEVSAANGLPIFWSEICSLPEFPYLFDCKTGPCFQIELTCDPFKDFIVITIPIKDSLIDTLFCNRFIFKHSLSKTKNEKVFKTIPIINPVTNDTTIWMYENLPQIKELSQNRKINHFFFTTIWNTYQRDTVIFFDPEKWKIKGRLDDKSILIERVAFKDSTFYENIQTILDLFEIKDYKYPQ